MRRSQLKAHPGEVREWLVAFLRERGVSETTSGLVIAELGEREVLEAHPRHGLGTDEGESQPLGEAKLHDELGRMRPLDQLAMG